MSAKKKVLFIDTTHPYLPEGMRSLGFICDQFDGFSKEEYKKVLPEYSGIIIRSKFCLDKAFLEVAKNLKFIARVGSGMENVDVEYAESKGVHCINAPEGNRDAVAEHAVGMILALFNHFFKAYLQVKDGVWKREENRGFELMGKTIGIIGYGNTGSAFAKRLIGFGVKVIAYDKYKKGFSCDEVQEVSMNEIFNQTDILSFHVPLTEETTYLFNDEYINNFTKNIYLVNTSRGKVVDTSALVRGLKSGKISGAALDVLEYEKLSFEDLTDLNLKNDFEYLTKADNVIITPHVAGLTAESNLKLAKVTFDKIKKVVRQDIEIRGAEVESRS